MEQHGYEDRGEIGERLSFEEQWEQKQERAEARAERLEQYAESASSRAADHGQTFCTMMNAIPFGQPILIGHHSEKWDRNYRKRADSHLAKASEEHEKARYFQQRAEASRGVAENSQLQNPVYLSYRIEECRAELREIERRGKRSVASHPGYQEKLTSWKAEVEEKLAFFEEHRKSAGPIFTKESLQGKSEVKIRNDWYRIVRLNPTSVTVPNICFRDVESQERWGFQYKYAEISDAR